MPRYIVSRPYGPEGNDKLFYQAVGHQYIKRWAMTLQTVSVPYGPEGIDKLFYQAVGHQYIKGWAKPVPKRALTLRKPREGRKKVVHSRCPYHLQVGFKPVKINKCP